MHILVFKYPKEEGNNLWGLYKYVLKGTIYSTVEKSFESTDGVWEIVQTDKQVGNNAGFLVDVWTRRLQR